MYIDPWPLLQLESIDIVIIGIMLFLASVGAKVNCKSSMSGSLSHKEISWQQTQYLNP